MLPTTLPPSMNPGVLQCSATTKQMPSNPVSATWGGEISKALGFTAEITGATALVVDQSNIFVAGRDRGFMVDWASVKTQLGGDHLDSASIVVSQAAGRRPQQDAFYAYLSRTGWDVYRHLALRNSDGSFSENEFFVDGDVRKLIRAAADTPTCGALCVMSGDGGMTNAVKYARRAGKKVYVVAWAGTLHPALAAAATAHMTIEELRPLISRVLH